MLRLIPEVKNLKIYDKTWSAATIKYKKGSLDSRLELALSAFETDESGIPLEIRVTGGQTEAYKLAINENGILIEADAEAGAFWAIQTLRQIFANGDEVPYLEICDKPDFEHRGFYHDITRGKIPTVETIKQLIDQMAYYKLNSLQLYVEHVYEFEECKELIKKTG